jgi:hypothetical protein
MGEFRQAENKICICKREVIGNIFVESQSLQDVQKSRKAADPPPRYFLLSSIPVITEECALHQSNRHFFVGQEGEDHAVVGGASRLTVEKTNASPQARR